MRATRCRAVPAYLLLVTFLLAWTLGPEAAPIRKQLLRLKAAGEFDPAAFVPAVPGDASLQAASREHDLERAAIRGRGHYLVQFDGPVQEHWKGLLTAGGAQILAYVPDFAYAVRVARGAVPTLRRIPHVRAVSPLHPAYVISPDLPSRGNRMQSVSVDTFTPSDLPDVLRRIRRLGGSVDSVGRQGGGSVNAQVPAAGIRPLARTFGVAWIEGRVPMRTFNGVAADITNVDSARTNVGLYGANQIIAVCDTGLDSGDNASVGLGASTGSLSLDFRGRVIATHTYNDRAPAWHDVDGHGTHVAGSVLGSGLAAGADPSTGNYQGAAGYAGMAPEAQLVFQSNGNALTTQLFTPDTVYYDVYQDAYDAGARIHSDSWGGATFGLYSTACRILDQFLWDHPDMLAVFAAGNAGRDTDANGIIDADSMASPAAAKNCLTVGASESLRTPSSSFPLVWGNFSNLVAAGEPVRSDQIANNIEGMAGFSSRGPCDDTRIKPDIAAPGTYIASVRSGGPLYDDVEAGPGNWSTARSSASVGNWSRTQSKGSASGTWAWYCPLNNTGPANGTSDLFQTVDTRRGGGTCNLSFQLRTAWGGTAAKLLIDYSTNGTTFTNIESATNGGISNFAYLSYLLPAAAESATLTLRFRFIHQNVAVEESNYAAIDNIRIHTSASGPRMHPALATRGSTVDEGYVLNNGTSMATPVVAGACALARQYYQEVLNHRDPSAALIKATVMAAAKDMTGQYATAFNTDLGQRPNNAEGWGRLDLEKALPNPLTAGVPRLLYVDNPRGLRTGESDTFSFTATNGAPLNVMLAYTDRPAASLAAVALVNDLDLDITGPGGPYSGNGVANDDRNNVEGVDIAAPTTGTYTVTVTGLNVSEGPQPYALVVFGANAARATNLTVTPAVAQVVRGQKFQFNALFDGRMTSGVTWSVQSGGGAIDAAGLYTAPGSGTSAVIRATAGSLTADASVTFIDTGTQVLFTFRINHDRFADLTSCTIGAGPDTGNPLLSIPLNITGVGGGGSGDFNLSVGITTPTAATNFLPPSAAHPWWIRVGDGTINAMDGTIAEFQIRFNSMVWSSRSGLIPLADGATATKWLEFNPPTNVAFTVPTNDLPVTGLVQVEATASDNDRIARVEFYEDDRLLASDASAPYGFPWDTTRATNMPHRLSVRAYDLSGNQSEAFRVITSINGSTRPNVVTGMSGWSFNAATRVLTATLTLSNTGTVNAHRLAVQRLTLFGTGPTFADTRSVNMQPSSGAPFPRTTTLLNAGSNTVINLTAVIPPEVTSIPRWTVSGGYFEVASGGTPYRL